MIAPGSGINFWCSHPYTPCRLSVDQPAANSNLQVATSNCRKIKKKSKIIINHVLKCSRFKTTCTHTHTHTHSQKNNIRSTGHSVHAKKPAATHSAFICMDARIYIICYWMPPANMCYFPGKKGNLKVYKTFQKRKKECSNATRNI